MLLRRDEMSHVTTRRKRSSHSRSVSASSISTFFGHSGCMLSYVNGSLLARTTRKMNKKPGNGDTSYFHF